jgi:hypothetical protein
MGRTKVQEWGDGSLGEEEKSDHRPKVAFLPLSQTPSSPLLHLPSTHAGFADLRHPPDSPAGRNRVG